MNHWWANQNQTYGHEIGGDFLWSPKANKNGGRNRFYDSMIEARSGDVVFSFSDTLIKAIGIVIGPCASAPKPTEFGTTGEQWSNQGWYLPVKFTELARPLKPKDHILEIAPTLPAKYSPLQQNGNGNQGVYLAPVPGGMATTLRRLLSGQVEAIEEDTSYVEDADGEREEQRVRADLTIPETERQQLINARVGQGKFRKRVAFLEPVCRVTGVSDQQFLRASHIKPWAASDNLEKLDGANGLMLAPHVDHLFDKGFITFDDEGNLVVSERLPSQVIQAWALRSANPKPLSLEQSVFMAYHREIVFKKL